MTSLRPAMLLAAVAAPLAACAGPAQQARAPAPARVVATPLPGSTARAPVVIVTPTPATVAVVAPPVPPSFPQHWDGSYQGRSVLVRANSPACPPSRRGVIEIGDSTLFFSYLPDTIFTTAVRDDGTMHGTAGATHLDGRIANNYLTMTISSPVCQTQYSGRYVWNHSYPP